MENNEEYESEGESFDDFDTSEQEKQYSYSFQRELTETEKFKKELDEELEAYDDPEAEFANLAIDYTLTFPTLYPSQYSPTPAERA